MWDVRLGVLCVVVSSCVMLVLVLVCNLWCVVCNVWCVVCVRCGVCVVCVVCGAAWHAENLRV